MNKPIHNYRQTLFLSLCGSVVFSLAGCQKNSTYELEKRIVKLEEKIIELEVNDILYGHSHSTWATFSPNESGFQSIETSSGKLLVTMKNIKPYANGYKVTFRIGNPLMAKISSLVLKLRWGKTNELKEGSSEIQITNKLRGGTWNNVEAVIAPAGKDDIAFIAVSIDGSQVELLAN